MSQPLAKQMTTAEFLAWAVAQPKGRFELVRGEIIAMAPEKARHSLTKGAAFRALGDAVRHADLPCTVFPDGMTVVVDDFTAYEPDAVVQCGAPVDLDSVVIPEPMIIVEVLSPSTQRLDAGGKLADYFRLPSLRHYLLIDAVRRAITHHARSEDGVIITRIFRDGELNLNPPGITLLVAQLLINL
jgi:Uma2 family endonuclease